MEGEGDCDNDDHCSGSLKCGTDNCVGDTLQLTTAATTQTRLQPPPNPNPSPHWSTSGLQPSQLTA